MPYVEVEVDLDEYKDNIKYHYCNAGKCLLNYADNKPFKQKFQEYVKTLRFDIEFRHETKDVNDILRDLENFADMLKE